ncbi:MAG TPA: cation diffusion facilitator family transporter [Alphaproteobacteria bacterium]
MREADAGGAVPGRAADAAHAGRLRRRATYASVAVATMLIVAKTAAWLLTGSVSVLSSLIDSLLDALASLVNLFAIRHSLTPADREHRFGHGKAEPLAGLAQAAFVAGSAMLLLMEAVQRLSAPTPIAREEIGIAVMLLSIAVTIALVLYQRNVIRATGSVAISADSLHYRGDLLVNGAVILSLLLGMWLDVGWIDPLFGIGIGLYILWGAIGIGRMSLDLLMDRELADADRARIRSIALDHPGVRDLHDLRTRSAGPDIFIQMHLEMDGDMPLRRAHEIADEVEAEIRKAFPNAEVIIHQDPAGLEEPPPHPARASW